TRTCPSASSAATSSRYSSVCTASAAAPGSARTASVATVAGRTSGATSWRMKKRMPRMLAMIASPPAVTTQRAALSTNRRLGDVLAEKRQIAVLDDDLLAFVRQDERQELLDQR